MTNSLKWADALGPLRALGFLVFFVCFWVTFGYPVKHGIYDALLSTWNLSRDRLKSKIWPSGTEGARKFQVCGRERNTKITWQGRKSGESGRGYGSAAPLKNRFLPAMAWPVMDQNREGQLRFCGKYRQWTHMLPVWRPVPPCSQPLSFSTSGFVGSSISPTKDETPLGHLKKIPVRSDPF